MKTITLLQTSGGTGKSTIALNIAYGLCNQGKKVLLIDTDSQANLTDTVLQDQSPAYFLNDILPTRIYDKSRNPSPEEILFPVSEALFLIGSDRNSDALSEMNKLDFTIIPYYLKTLLDKYEEDFDYCIIDTPSHMDFITKEAMAASDSLIIPLSVANHHSVFNFDRLINHIVSIQEKYNPDLSIEGIVITGFSEKNQIDHDIKEAIETIASSLEIPLFPSPIRRAVKQAEATFLGLSVFEHCPKSFITRDYQDMIDQILKNECKDPDPSKEKEEDFFESQPAAVDEEQAEKDRARSAYLERLHLVSKKAIKKRSMSLKVTESTYQRLQDLKKDLDIAVNTIINAILEDFLDEVDAEVEAEEFDPE